MHDVAVSFHGHKFVDMDGIGLANTGQVIAAEVDEHDVLSAFFFVGEQLLLQREVLFGGGAPFACAGEWAVGDGVVVDAAEDFGAGGDEDGAASLEVDHVGAGVDNAQGAVEVEGIS